MKRITRWILVAAMATFMGCAKPPSGGDGNPTTGTTLSGQAFKTLSGNLNVSANGVSGTGSLIFVNPMFEEDNNYALDFSVEEGGSVTLSTNADTTLNTAINVSFARKNDALVATLEAAGEKQDLSPDLVGKLDATGPMSLAVDVHQHGHAILFVNGQEVEEYAFGAKLDGTFWGLKLEKATVTKAAIGKAIEEHD